MIENYEKLGAFYLGKGYDLVSRQLQPDPILYDAKDLTTHAVIIGMTGSGKTGLGIDLIEEALIDNIPVIAIDPKGDLPNLLLTFPDLMPKDFRPWVNPQDATSKGKTLDQYASQQAKMWQEGVAAWDQDNQRIARLKAAADFTVYTPGSTAGVPVSILRSFTPPPPVVLEDLDLLRERIQTTVTGLLALLGIEADPITDREHIFLSNIFQRAWTEGRALDLAGLIQAIQAPPFERIGVMDLEFFYPAKERFGLAMRMNNLLAAPGFEAWMEGEPLDIGNLLYTPQGRPRAAIFTISHLSDAQRMFFISTLLNEILGWIRTQPGTTSLRAMLYMDEIYGFFPPVRNPPSKAPLLTLLKQARAYGLGVVLSTQNPVDLDYKGLANTGTWFIGRLQTERDKERVLAGLEGVAAGQGFDRGQMSEVLAGLGKRIFLLHNVHENAPVIFQTRWTLSYLSGPMTREQIKLLADLKPQSPAQTTLKAPSVISIPSAPVAAAALAEPATMAAGPPATPPGIDIFYLAASGAGKKLVYYPAVVGRMDVHYADSTYGVDTTETIALAGELEDGPVPLDWDNAVAFNAAVLETRPMSGAEYGELPTGAKKAGVYRKWSRDLLRWVQQNRALTLYHSKEFKLTSTLGESEGAFRGRLAQVVRETRDLQAEKLRQKYNSRFTTLRDRLMRAEQAVDREQEQSKAQGMQTAISFGSAILGAFLGRKVVSSGSAYRMGSAMKSASRMRKEKMDVNRAAERADSLRRQLDDLDSRLKKDIEKIEMQFNPELVELREISIKPKSTGITLEAFGLAWMPYRRNTSGGLVKDWE